MDPQIFDALLYRGESEMLDFKVDQYAFAGAQDHEQSELLKDILAFANAWRDSDAYILIGVQENPGGKAIVQGISTHLEDHALQQFVNSKTQRPVSFRYEALQIEGKQCGVIHIPVQERPLFLRKDFSKLKAEIVYIRRGSSTDQADPDEVRKMGSVIAQIPAPVFDAHSDIRVSQSGAYFHFTLSVWLFNVGKATAYEVVVDFAGGDERVTFQSDWEKRRPPNAGERRLALKEPLHPGDHRLFATWTIGDAELSGTALFKLQRGAIFNPSVHQCFYRGKPVDIRLRILARDLSPVKLQARFSPQEIEGLMRKRLMPPEDIS